MQTYEALRAMKGRGTKTLVGRLYTGQVVRVDGMKYRVQARPAIDTTGTAVVEVYSADNQHDTLYLNANEFVPVLGDLAFNPHGERTSDGTLIVPGLRVLDYNRNPGVVVADRDADEYSCPAHPNYQFPGNKVHGCYNGWDKPTHWFDVKRDDNGGLGMFDGSRMQAIR